MKDDYSKLDILANGEILVLTNLGRQREIQEEVVIDDHKFNRSRVVLPYYHGSLE